MIFLYIYLFSTVAMLLLSAYEWKTEEDHKGWTKSQYAISCFVPVANTCYIVSAIVYFFKWINKNEYESTL